MKKLNAVGRKWVAALRSGKYKQGRGQLRGGNKFCCLGVLCELAVKAKVIDRFSNGTYAGDGAECPPEVMNWSGLASPTGRIQKGDLISLAKANDRGKRFTTIARLIEENAEELGLAE